MCQVVAWPDEYWRRDVVATKAEGVLGPLGHPCRALFAFSAAASAERADGVLMPRWTNDRGARNHTGNPGHLVTCTTPGCKRKFFFHNGRTCCDEYGALTGDGTWMHTPSCQKQQCRLGRNNLDLVVEASVVCSTPGCSRRHVPGYSACCSRCGASHGRRHSSRRGWMANRLVFSSSAATFTALPPGGTTLVESPVIDEDGTVVPTGSGVHTLATAEEQTLAHGMHDAAGASTSDMGSERARGMSFYPPGQGSCEYAREPLRGFTSIQMYANVWPDTQAPGDPITCAGAEADLLVME